MICGKITYTKKEAEAAIKDITQNHRTQHRKERRYYYCSRCNAWHLTSKELNPEGLVNVKLKRKKEWLQLLNN